MPNLYQQFMALLPKDRLLVGDVIEADGAGVVVELPGGDLLHARGAASVGDRVFVRGGVVEGPAPTLTVVTIEI